MGIEQYLYCDIFGGEWFVGYLLVGFDVQEGVGVVQVLLFVDLQCEFFYEVGVGDDYILCVVVGDVQLCFDCVRMIVDMGDYVVLNVLYVIFEIELCGGGQGWQVVEYYCEFVQQWQYLVLFGFLLLQLGEFGDFVGMFGCQVFCLGEVIWQVVQFLDVLVWVVGFWCELLYCFW